MLIWCHTSLKRGGYDQLILSWHRSSFIITSRLDIKICNPVSHGEGFNLEVQIPIFKDYLALWERTGVNCGSCCRLFCCFWSCFSIFCGMRVFFLWTENKQNWFYSIQLCLNILYHFIYFTVNKLEKEYLLQLFVCCK